MKTLCLKSHLTKILFASLALLQISFNLLYAQWCIPAGPYSPVTYWSVDPPTFCFTPANGPSCISVDLGIKVLSQCPITFQNLPLIIWGGFPGDSCYVISNASWNGYFALNTSNCWATHTNGFGITWHGLGADIRRLAAALPPAILVSPGNGATNIPVTPIMNWNSVDSATSYRIKIYRGMCNIIVDFDSLTAGTTIQVPPGKLKGSTRYNWRVKPYKTGGEGPFSDPFYFTTTISAPPPAPILVSPLSGTSVQTLTPILDWDNSIGAAGYNIQISRNSSFSNLIFDSTGLINSNMTVRAGLLQADSIYHWHVRAYNPYGNSSWSAPWNFTVNLRPSAPNLVSPPTGTSVQTLTPLLDWDNSPGATGYNVQISRNSLFSVLLLDTSGLTNADMIVRSGILQADSVYYWRVKAYNTYGSSSWSPAWNFLVSLQPDVRLTYNSAVSQTSLNHDWCIAASGDTVHVTWFDERDGFTQIYYKRSTDKGISWGPDTRLTNTSSYAERGGIAVNGSVIHIVWQDGRNGWEIYYLRSTNAGTTWEPETRLTIASGNSWAPMVSVYGQTVHVLWTETRDGNTEVYYKRSSNGGTNWSSDTRLTNNSSDSWYATCIQSGSTVHVLWTDMRDGNYEIYYKRSTDAGLSWGADTRLTNTTSSSQNPTIAANGSFVYTVWYDDRDGNFELYYKRSSDDGLNWGADTRLTNAAGESGTPSLVCSGYNLHLTWEDLRDGNREIYYKRSTTGGSSWEPDIRLTNAAGDSRYASVCVSGPVVHTVWFDDRDGNREIYYRRQPTGNLVGIKKIETKIPDMFSLEQNYPNPFNPVTKIKFGIPKTVNVTIRIYDLLGKEIEMPVNEMLTPGIYTIDWDGTNYPSGVYYYSINAVSFFQSKKMVLVK